MVAGIVANSMFGVIRGAILVAVLAGQSGATVAGYTAGSLSTYNWLTQALLGPISLWGTNEISSRVRTGDIAIDLSRPLNLQAAYLAQDLGYALAAVLPRSLPTLVVGAVTFGIALPTSVSTWAVGLLSFALALVVSFLGRFVLQMFAFWFTDIRGFEMIYSGCAGLLGGLIMPIYFMPDWLARIAHATPFPSIMQAPVDVLSGRISGDAVWSAVVTQVGWIVLLTALGQVLLSLGRREVVVQGG